MKIIIGYHIIRHKHDRFLYLRDEVLELHKSNILINWKHESTVGGVQQQLIIVNQLLAIINNYLS